MSDPDRGQRPTFEPGQGPGLGRKNEIPYGLTKTQFVVGLVVLILLFFVAFGLAMSWQGE
ncbi:hypothetical protein [Roseomonas sp. CECT 9278]|uniref:hypothetical protein n=1 Tax=Roseomonas sp. CECT 9278 TaxID=2845823 RepID=UPI001E298D54|nr:hypothetical protein [Roseomonas sp. CECT 9278]CAH0224308.1 hypothetical protein ROS9278_02488 [Roseomonas sp. CECT 9278]